MSDQAPDIKPGAFPPEKDLQEGDVTIGAVIPHRQAVYGNRELGNKTSYVIEEYRRQVGEPCDVILLAVPAGRGQPFVEGLMQSLNGPAARPYHRTAGGS